MPAWIWLAICAYLIVCAVSLFEAELRPARGAAPGWLACAVAALAFAAAWPLRLLREFRL